MSRSQGVQHPGLITRLLFFFAKRAIGRVPAGMRIRAFDPKYLRNAARMDVYSAASGTVPMHLKELAQLKVALMVGCPFWIDIHSAVGRKTGITEQQLQDLAQFESSPQFDEQEKTVLHLTTALTRIPTNVADELYAALRQHFSERQLLELTAVITWENARARFNRVYAIPAEGFSEGAYCPLPETVTSDSHSSVTSAM